MSNAFRAVICDFTARSVTVKLRINPEIILIENKIDISSLLFLLSLQSGSAVIIFTLSFSLSASLLSSQSLFWLMQSGWIPCWERAGHLLLNVMRCLEVPFSFPTQSIVSRFGFLIYFGQTFSSLEKNHS